MTQLSGRSAAILLLAALLLTGCGGGGPAAPRTPGVASTPPPASPSPTAAASPTAASDGKHSVAEVAQRPCLALGAEQTTELGVVMAPSETDLGGPSCQWWTRDGLISFTPYPRSDETTRSDVRHLTRRTIAGHRAVLGTLDRGGCSMYVSVGTRQSFRLLSSPSPRDAPEVPEDCGLNTRFATAILARLE
ncbi:DUF3558 family protein [Plantactinospora sp. CA-290183]|uniref:DUF3558 family protein n=1 Tax=Plantactinospora sp. CA-290183 TaxID=3240006 RepID=UPI003D8F6006